jgi:hypothetical protein
MLETCDDFGLRCSDEDVEYEIKLRAIFVIYFNIMK